MIDNIHNEIIQFKKQLNSITRSRTPFQLKHFVVKQHESRFKQWYQLIIECDEKYRALQEAEANKRICELDIEEMKLELLEKPATKLSQIKNEKRKVEIQRKENQLEHLNILMIGAMKEVQDLLELAKTDYSDFWDKSEDELYQEHELDYWIERFSRQIQIDICTFGKVQPGNLGAILQLPESDQKKVLKRSLEKADEHLRIAAQVEKFHQAELVQAEAKLKKSIERIIPING